jgi:hypothetical protein
MLQCWRPDIARCLMAAGFLLRSLFAQQKSPACRGRAAAFEGQGRQYQAAWSAV